MSSWRDKRGGQPGGGVRPTWHYLLSLLVGKAVRRECSPIGTVMVLVGLALLVRVGPGQTQGC